MATAIAFQSVTKRFSNDKLGLDDATWYVEEGAHVCLLGATGSGKTTAVRILQRALQPTGGSVMLLGVPVDGPGYRSVRRHLGILPQGPGMYQDLTAGEFMALAARLYGARPDRAVERLHLTDYLHARMADLSRGFQRRLALAAALVADPDVLVLDDPTTGLDRVAAEHLKLYVRDAMRGRTALLCTQHRGDAEALCSEVIYLRDGQVAARGTWADLRRQGQPKLRLAARQGPDRVLAELAELGMYGERDDGVVLVSMADPEQEGGALLRRLLEAGIDVYECAPVRPPLESIVQEAYQ
ncbi:MAG TPA: ABC transporter ATP-binding protein [Candidatus Dormibacteraeota bacterium]|nr:ABC transporter ATP-binding protein [Candidatus Dormibacteraeota bacterium]